MPPRSFGRTEGTERESRVELIFDPKLMAGTLMIGICWEFVENLDRVGVREDSFEALHLRRSLCRFFFLKGVEGEGENFDVVGGNWIGD